MSASAFSRPEKDALLQKHPDFREPSSLLFEIRDQLVRIGQEIASGNEHLVYRSGDGQTITKIPSRMGRLWQVMTPEAAHRDLQVMQHYLGDMVAPTTLVPHPLVESINDICDHMKETRRRVTYAFQQPYLPAKPVDARDLLLNPAWAERFSFLMEQRERIYREQGLGLDLFGGKSLGASLRMIYTDQNPALENVVVLRDDAGPLKKGDMKIWDTRLLDFKRVKNPLFAWMVRGMHDLQTGAGAVIARGVGKPCDPALLNPDRLTSPFERLGKTIANAALRRSRK